MKNKITSSFWRHSFLVLGVAAFTLLIFCSSPQALWAQMSTEDIIKKLESLQDRVNQLEKDVANKNQEIQRLKGDQGGQTEGTNAEEAHGGVLDTIADRFSIGGLIEVGAVYDHVQEDQGPSESASDINLTTVELGMGVEVNDWTHAEWTFLYEDAMGNTAEDEGDVALDAATVTFGNPEVCPFYATAGKLFVPFGALLTHFPDDPLVDQPLTLAFGEISEKAVVIGYEKSGFAVSGYVFNGEVNESASDNGIEHFGFDLNYTVPEDTGLEIFGGLSYISSIAEGMGGVLHDGVIQDYVGGLALYLHLGVNDLFFDAEYMTALDEFAVGELGELEADKPSVWNIEAGYNWDWGKNLEIALKYAGSDEAGALEFPDTRYGIAFNQEIYEGIIGSVAYYRDDFETDNIDRDLLCAQIAVEF